VFKQPEPALGRYWHNRLMPMDYFQTLDTKMLPLRVADAHALRCIAVLRAAELLEADIVNDSEGQAVSATIHRITYQGEAALEKARRRPPE
jgi:hypothetical protein